MQLKNSVVQYSPKHRESWEIKDAVILSVGPNIILRDIAYRSRAIRIIQIELNGSVIDLRFTVNAKDKEVLEDKHLFKGAKYSGKITYNVSKNMSYYQTEGYIDNISYYSTQYINGYTIGAIVGNKPVVLTPPMVLKHPNKHASTIDDDDDNSLDDSDIDEDTKLFNEIIAEIKGDNDSKWKCPYSDQDLNEFFRKILSVKRDQVMVTPEQLTELYKEQKGICQLTGKHMPIKNTKFDEQASPDRIIPGIFGGKYEIENIRLVSLAANRVRGILKDEELARVVEDIYNYNQAKKGNPF